ncbi:unnamed protein product, partial [Pylaiella littoralis]
VDPDHFPPRCQCRGVLRGVVLTRVNGQPFTRRLSSLLLHSVMRTRLQRNHNRRHTIHLRNRYISTHK